MHNTTVILIIVTKRQKPNTTPQHLLSYREFKQRLDALRAAFINQRQSTTKSIEFLEPGLPFSKTIHQRSAAKNKHAREHNACTKPSQRLTSPSQIR
jgi:hypothetical protein